MRAATLLLTSCLVMAPAMAQGNGENSPQPTTPAPEQPQNADRGNQRIERIQHEDGGSRVDELRVGGETKNITVQPKVGNMPAYEVQPENREGAEGTNGRRVWRAIQF